MNVTHGDDGDRQTTTVQLCRECAELAVQTVTYETARYEHLALRSFQCALGHLQFDVLEPVPQTPHTHATAA